MEERGGEEGRREWMGSLTSFWSVRFVPRFLWIYHEVFDTLSFPRADWATFKHTLAFKKSLVIQQ